MRLESFTIAVAATVEGKRISMLGAGITRLTPPMLPWKEPSLALVLHFDLAREDFGSAHEFVITFRQPDGTPAVPPVSVEASADQLQSTLDTALPGERLGLNLVLMLHAVPLTQEGLHEIVVAVDGDELQRFSLPVAVKPSS